MTWDDAVAYCESLTLHERAVGRLPNGYAYRLPNEAEWEYACRAGKRTRFSYGDDPDLMRLGEYAWYFENSEATTHPVGQKKPNPWGLYDMHGNVWEWCADWYTGSHPGGTVTDPIGPSSGSVRVQRGGGYHNIDAQYCRSAARHWNPPDNPDSRVGFRLVLAPDQP